MVQNKIDIEPEKQNEELNKFINEHPDIDHIKISIKNNNNLNELLLKIYNIFNFQEKTSIPLNQVFKCKYSPKINIVVENSCTLILLGSQNVGKTNFLTRYDSNAFNPIITTTVGLNTGIKILKINNKNIYKLTIWDTAGQERFRSIPEKYFKKADGVLVLFDLNNRESFLDLADWLKIIKEFQGNEKKENENIIIYLLGNKIDLNNNRIISRNSGLDKAKKMGMDKFAEVSAKTKENLMEIFREFYMEIYHKNKKKIMEKKNKNMKTFESLQKQENSNNGCC